MSAGSLSSAEQASLDATIRAAEQQCRAEISVFVGPIDGQDPHAFATSLHNTLVLPSRSILVMIDPTLRAVEVITGGEVRRNLTDAEAALVVEEYPILRRRRSVGRADPGHPPARRARSLTD